MPYRSPGLLWVISWSLWAFSGDRWVPKEQPQALVGGATWGALWLLRKGLCPQLLQTPPRQLQNGLAFPGDGEISQVVAAGSSMESTQRVLAMLEMFFRWGEEQAARSSQQRERAQPPWLSSLCWLQVLEKWMALTWMGLLLVAGCWLSQMWEEQSWGA